MNNSINKSVNASARSFLKRSNLSGIAKTDVDTQKQELVKKHLLKQINKDLNLNNKQAKSDINKNINSNKTIQKNNIKQNNEVKTNRNSNIRKPFIKPIATTKKVNNINTASNVRINEKPSKAGKGLKIMFLGGVGEIGKNMMAVEYGNDIILIDAGSAFPGEDLPGIDLIVPDISYLMQNKHKVKAVVITHGHEDHIGSLPYLLNDINVPVYGSRMALALVERKLSEHRRIKPKLITVKAGQTIKLNSFSVEFIHVNHSIAGAFALAITSPVGTWVHTGDFKVDFTPIDGNVIDLPRFAELGKKGVLLLTADSTNVERSGYTMSESSVGKSIDVLFSQYKEKRIFVATFASNIYRLQQLLDLAVKYGRKVALTGRSMLNVIEVASKIGELKVNKDILIPIEKAKKLKNSEVLVLSTGSQGEPFSALTRMSTGIFKQVSLNKDDVIIFSASPIPGNEKAVGRVINNLYKIGCEVINNKLAEVHVSGHAKVEELKLIHSLVNPKFFIPAHGEYRMLKKHADLAMSMGKPARNIIITEIGSRVELTKTTMKLTGTVPAGRRLVDGLGFGEMESIVLRDRKLLSEDGICVVMLSVNTASGQLTSEPDIITRGFMYSTDSNRVINDAKDVVKSAVTELSLKEGEWGVVKGSVKKALSNHFYRKTKRRPMILTFVLEN